jgi:hypothetical protein
MDFGSEHIYVPADEKAEKPELIPKSSFAPPKRVNLGLTQEVHSSLVKKLNRRDGTS